MNNKQKSSESAVSRVIIEPVSDFAPSEATVLKQHRRMLKDAIERSEQNEPTPYQLASLAVMLNRKGAAELGKEVEKHGEALDRRFRLARRLLKAADRHLMQEPYSDSDAELIAVRREMEHDIERFPKIGPGRQLVYPFELLLKEVEPPQGGRKKGKTMLGSITTRQGLHAAIKRIFTKEARSILEAGFLTMRQFRALMADPDRRGMTRFPGSPKSVKK